MNDSYTIKDIINLLLGKLWLIILLAVLGGGGAYAYAHFMMPNQYESYTSMYVKSSSNTIGSFDINLGDLNASRSLLSTYTVVLKSNYVMNEVAEQLELEYTDDELAEVFSMQNHKISLSSLRSKVTMSSVESTEVMKITANTTNPEISAAICNSIAESAEECLIRIVGAGSVEIIDEAEPIYKPVSPNKPKTALIGAMAGLVLAAFIILLIDFFDNSIRVSETLTNRYQKAVFGEIINFSDGGSKKSETERTNKTILDPKMDFNVVENYKSIRSNIMFAFSTMKRKILAVSSANPSEGKSTTISNIAIAFAQTEGRVLLIDADMRKPVQHKVFNLSNKKGLSTAIGHMNPLEESIHKNVYKQLDVMPSGPIPPNPSEMLASQQFADLLDELEPQYDYILLDTPPVNVVSDTMVMGKVVSGLLLVVKHGHTTFEELQDAINHADLSEINVIGFVLNNISRKGSGHYYSYKYKYKYKYKSYEYHYVSNSEEKLGETPTISMKEEVPITASVEKKETAPEEKAVETPVETVEESAPEETAVETPIETVEESAPVEETAPEETPVETPVETVEESAPVEETAPEEKAVETLVETVEESAPVEETAPEETAVETPVETVEESAPVEETAPEEKAVETLVETVEESAPVEETAPEQTAVETPVETVEESAPVQETAPEQTAVETPVETVEESAPVQETAPEETAVKTLAEIVEESAPIPENAIVETVIETPAELLEAENLLEEIPVQDAGEAPIKSAIEEAPVTLTEGTAVEESDMSNIEITPVNLTKESDKKEGE